MSELENGMRARHEAAGKFVVERFIRPKTPVGTPESTGDPNYKVTYALRRSIEYRATSDSVIMGTNKSYGPYVSQGTYDYAHGYRGWTEAEAREFDSLTDTGDGPGRGRKGMRARPYLVNGLLDARAFLKPIYNRPIEGGK
jgi:hypothetical protein